MGTRETSRRVVRAGQEPLATLIEQVNANARDARNGQIAFAVLLGLAYALLFSVTHRQLFLNEAVRLPFLNLTVPLDLFFIVAPMLVLLLHFVLLQRHVVLAGQLQALANHPGFHVEHCEPLLSGNFFVQRRVGRQRGWLFGFLLWLREWLLLYGLPAALLVLLLWRFLPFHDERITWAQRIVLWLDLGMMVIFAILLRRPEGPLFTKHWPSCPTWASMLLAYVTALLTLFLNVPYGGVAGKGWLERQLLQTWTCQPVEVGFISNRQACWLTAALTEQDWVPDFFRRNLMVANEDLVPDRQWEPKNEPSLRLTGRDFRYAYLLESDLHRANLRNVLLQGAVLSGVNLKGADLTKANFQEATLDNSNLQYANLFESILYKSIINVANLRESYLINAYLQYAQLSGANLQGSDLRGAYLQGADLRNADLSGADLNKANLQGALLNGARLQGAYLSGAKLQGADLRGAKLQGAVLAWANLQGADLRGAYLQGAIFFKANLQGTDLKGSDMSAAWLEDAKIWLSTSPSNIYAETIKLGIKLAPNLNDTEKTNIRRLIEGNLLSANAAVRLHALLNTQLRLMWQKTKDFKFWLQHTGAPDKKAKHLLLLRHGKARATILCESSTEIRSKIVQRLLGDVTTWELWASDPASERAAAYMWQLCLRGSKESLTGNVDIDSLVQRRFQDLAHKLLPQAQSDP